MSRGEPSVERARVHHSLQAPEHEHHIGRAIRLQVRRLAIHDHRLDLAVDFRRALQEQLGAEPVQRRTLGLGTIRICGGDDELALFGESRGEQLGVPALSRPVLDDRLRGRKAEELERFHRVTGAVAHDVLGRAMLARHRGFDRRASTRIRLVRERLALGEDFGGQALHLRLIFGRELREVRVELLLGFCRLLFLFGRLWRRCGLSCGRRLGSDRCWRRRWWWNRLGRATAACDVQTEDE